MATPIAGTGGTVYVVGTPDVLLGEVKQWDLEIDREVYDASTLGVTTRRKVGGLGDWKGKLTGFYAVSTDQGQTLLQNAVLNYGVVLYLQLKTSTNTYEGNAIPSRIDISNPVDGITTFDVEFEGSDPLLFD